MPWFWTNGNKLRLRPQMFQTQGLQLSGATSFSTHDATSESAAFLQSQLCTACAASIPTIAALAASSLRLGRAWPWAWGSTIPTILTIAAFLWGTFGNIFASTGCLAAFLLLHGFHHLWVLCLVFCFGFHFWLCRGLLSILAGRALGNNLLCLFQLARWTFQLQPLLSDRHFHPDLCHAAFLIAVRELRSRTRLRGSKVRPGSILLHTARHC